MNGYLCAVRVIFLGLLTSQIIALIQVYLSNTGLYHALLAISEAGYLAIPNQEIVPSLQGFRPAFFGGLFFSLTIGAGLSLLSYAVIWVWDRLFSRNKYLGIFFLLLWLGCLSAVNHKGLEPMVTSYFFFIPAVVTIASLRWIHPKYGQKKWRHIAAMFFIPLFLLAILWRSQATSHLFIDLRDYLLLSNRLGVKINDFYYRYTLYAAEVFKALDQKLLKTYRLGDIQDVFLVPTIEKELAENDYLRVDGYPSVDLNVSQEGNFLVFKHRDRTILKAIPSEFFSNPGKVLKEFSLKSDRHGFFRKFTFISLLLGSPVILYLIFFTMFYMFLSFFLDNRTSSLFASILCFMIGITLLGLLHNSEAEIGEVKNVTEALRSQRWQERIAALKTIEKRGLEIGNFNAYRSMLTSPHISERYWLARALGASRKEETYKELSLLLDDSHSNVVSMAFYALGRRGDKNAIIEILNRIRLSGDWYNQWYAYKALRALGWKQTESNSEF